jgi:hypothetical protein
MQTVGSAGIYQNFPSSIRNEFHWLSSVRQTNCTGTLHFSFKEQNCPNTDLPTFGYVLCLWPSRTISHKFVQNYDTERKGAAQFYVSRSVPCSQTVHNTQSTKCIMFFLTYWYHIVNYKYCYIFQYTKESSSRKMYQIILHKTHLVIVTHMYYFMHSVEVTSGKT